MIREAISKLVVGDSVNGDEAYATMKQIMIGEATDAQIAAYITALRLRGETPDIIHGSVRAMREQCTAINAPRKPVVDTCGTGGDGAHTFNISTAAAFVTAGAGVTVAKHGNRGVSSKCGSADVLKALGVNITADPSIMETCLNEIGIAFLFAPSLHPAMKFAIGPRREIGIRTVFNILGPLSNPAGAQYGVLGVFAADMVPRMAEAAALLGAQHVFIVHGRDGLDEITTTNRTLVAEVKNGEVNQIDLDSTELGIDKANPDDLVGGEPEENATILKHILKGKRGPKRDIVLLNAAASIVAGQKAENLQDGITLAAESIDSGSAIDKLDQLVARTSNPT